MASEGRSFVREAAVSHEEEAVTGTLRIRVHLLGGQTMQGIAESSLEPEEYAANLRDSLNRAGRGFITIGELGFHTNAIAGFDVDTL